MKKTTIDRNLMPNMWLTWETTKGKFWLNCDTGEKHTEKPDVEFRHYIEGCSHLINSGSRPRYAYAKYHADIERLELAEVTIETTRGEAVKEWKYSGNKYFLGKDKSVLDENGKEVTDRYVLSLRHMGYTFKEFLSMYYRICYHKEIVKEFIKFLGSNTFTIGSGRVVTVTHAWHILEWYKTSQKVRKPGKQQKLTDKLTAMPVSDTTGLSEKYPPINVPGSYYFSSINGIIYFERLDDGWSVLRVFDRNPDTHSVKEIERMYLHDDGSNRIVSPTKDGWVPYKTFNSWYYYNIVNKNEAMEQCKRLKYIIPHLKDVKYGNIKSTLMNILRFPELEQMITLGHSKEAMDVARSNTPKADLRHMFGEYWNEKETTLLRKAGLTKHQFDKYMYGYDTAHASHETALSEMRRFFENDFIHLDNASFDKYFDAFRSMHRGWRQSSVYPQLDRLTVDKKKFIKNMVRIGEKHSTAYQLADDALSMYVCLNYGTQPEINWYFDNYSDIVRAHDAIEELKRAQDAERRALWDKDAAERRKKEEEKRAKVDAERKKYEYEDDEYVIRLPKDLNEIVAEGSRQRICIGGYTTRHAYGETNLFFLRKKSEPTVAFYAIEMNNNVIIQIHGYCNAWLGNDPDAIPTVVRWLRKNGIKCDKKILTCKAKGYCSTNEYVEMPVVD